MVIDSEAFPLPFNKPNPIHKRFNAGFHNTISHLVFMQTPWQFGRIATRSLIEPGIRGSIPGRSSQTQCCQQLITASTLFQKGVLLRRNDAEMSSIDLIHVAGVFRIFDFCISQERKLEVKTPLRFLRAQLVINRLGHS